MREPRHAALFLFAAMALALGGSVERTGLSEFGKFKRRGGTEFA